MAAQTCPPAERLPTAGTVSDVLDSAACHLADNTAYKPYRLLLATRGKLSLGVDRGTLILRDDHGVKLASGASIDRPAERGTYSVLVTGSAGAFTLRSNFTPAANTLCRGFPALGVGQTVSGSLGAASCLTLAGSPYDAYTLHTPAGGTLTLTVTASGFSPAIWLRDASGRLVASGSPSATYAVRGDGHYTAVVTGSGEGSYQLSTSFTIDPAETCRAAGTFTGGGQDAGTITTRSCSTRDAVTGFVWTYNYYDLNPAEAGTVELRASSTAFAPMLRLLDADGNLLAADSLGGGSRTSVLRLPLGAGRYRAMVVSPDGTTGNYTFTFTLTPEPPRNCEVKGVLSTSGSVTGVLSAASCRTADGYSDVYHLAPEAAGIIQISAGSNDYDTVVTLRDSQDNVLTRGDLLTGSAVIAEVAPGTYSVTVSASANSGGYTLATRFVQVTKGACGGLNIELNGGYLNQFGVDTCRTAAGQPVDYYEFTLPAEGMIAAIMTASQMDSYLQLEDASGNLLRWDDNSYGANDAIILQHLPAGRYRLAAQAVFGGWRGIYRLDLLNLPGPAPAGCTPLAPLIPGTPVDRNLVFTSCQYTSDTFADIYRLEVANAATFEVQMRSTFFDTGLEILDAQGNLVASADHGEENPDSLLRHRFDPGTYYVVAKAAGDYSSQGYYTLTANPVPE